jgi:hypothetical protein
MSRNLIKNIRTSVSDTPEILAGCISPASFWPVENLVADSAWLEHAPFAFWLTESLRPRTFVELGTHGGFSYFAFCQAVQRLGVEAKCYAIDTWQGDEHSGHYGEQIFDAVKAYNDQHYSAFSDLIRSTFDEASSDFSDGTVDLLHIDGRHFYEDVEHDFETWRPKLSDRAIVLFHDTNVRERGFGVFKLWEKLRNSHPSFEFVHGHGLGVLGVGRESTEPLSDLFASSETDTLVSVRASYARLGSAVSTEAKNFLLQHEVQQKSQEIEQALERLKFADDENRQLKQSLINHEEEIKGLISKLAEISGFVERLQTDIAARERTIMIERATNRALLNSTSWKITSPLRALARALGQKRR